MTDKQVYIRKIGKTVFVKYSFDGTSNDTALTFTVPNASASFSGGGFHSTWAYGTDNSSDVTAPGYVYLAPNSSTVGCYKTFSGLGGWTNTGVKRCSGQFFYEMA
jgi:hypothetical protein